MLKPSNGTPQIGQKTGGQCSRLAGFGPQKEPKEETPKRSYRIAEHNDSKKWENG
jgi:hypothetical protein